MKPSIFAINILMITSAMPLQSYSKPLTQDFIGRNTTILRDGSDLMTPEALWAMGRVGSFSLAPDGRHAVYQVSYYSVPQNKSHRVLYTLNQDRHASSLLTTSSANESDAVYIHQGKQILYLSNQGGSSQLWQMNADGSGRKQLSQLDRDVEGFLISPDEHKILLIMQVDDTTAIERKYQDLPQASGMVINELMYKHWDHFVTSVPHPFIANFGDEGVSHVQDILKGEPYECPTAPFGGIEQLCWSPDSKRVAYSCRKKVARKYATSTDSDIYLYDTETGQTTNLCKTADFQEPATDYTRSLKDQAINHLDKDQNVGYDTNPQFSPDGRYIAWQSMARDGYESDRNRLCVLTLATGQKRYVTESFESGVDTYCWGKDSKTLYFTGVWHGTSMVYSTTLQGSVRKLTDGIWDYSICGLSHDGSHLIVKRHSMSQADEVYSIQLAKSHPVTQLTEENKYFYDHLTMGKVEERWIPTVDGKQEQAWIIYPPHFDSTQTYPTLLYCEGGPQSPVSQFWSFRWNFQIMASHGYIIVAPNRRGLPGYGMDWLEEISGDYSGLCMQDYLSAIDEVSKDPYVDKSRLGCVGASFGGYSVYWLAGHHNKRFKCFIAHDGIFNTCQQYGETEEMWFPNWDLGAAPWVTPDAPVYKDSPHLSIGKWDTPILCIHGMCDYRILHSQAEAAFAEARMRGIPAELLLFPDENHWVLKPQNGILWQRTFFRWLDRWLKP